MFLPVGAGSLHMLDARTAAPLASAALGIAPGCIAVDERQRRSTILDAIGGTPLVQVDGIWVKLEYLNPSGSVKEPVPV